jgi:phosphatidylglycerol:prolipoprotein diacylglycerol transferase
MALKYNFQERMKMWPKIGPINTYGIFYFIGIFLHYQFCCLFAERLGLRRRVWIAVSVCYTFGMIVGAKVLYDIQHTQFNLRALLSIGHYMKGGFWGGLLPYLCISVPLVLVLSKRRRAALDLIALSIPIPWFFAKLGCLLNGCCYGRECSMPWAITFPEGSTDAPAGIPLHPTQIYEMLVVLCILGVFKILKRRWGSGTMLLWFLIFYGIGRSATELWRGDVDHHLYIGPLTLSQLFCLAVAGVSILGLCLHKYISPPTKPDKVLI